MTKSMKGISIFALPLVVFLSGCLTIRTKNAEVVAVGSVERAHVSPAGEVTIEKSSSPLERLTDGLSNTGMFAWLKAFTR